MNSFASKIIVVDNTAAEKLSQQGQVNTAKKNIHLSQNPKDSIPVTQQAPFRAVRDSAGIRDSENAFCKMKRCLQKWARPSKRQPRTVVMDHLICHLQGHRAPVSSVLATGVKAAWVQMSNWHRGGQVIVRYPFCNGYLQGMHWAVES